MLRNLQTIVKRVQQMQQTYPTNDKHFKNVSKKQFVVITHAKNIQTNVKKSANNSKHIYKTCNKHTKQMTKTSKMTKTICCNIKCKTHTKM